MMDSLRPRLPGESGGFRASFSHFLCAREFRPSGAPTFPRRATSRLQCPFKIIASKRPDKWRICPVQRPQLTEFIKRLNPDSVAIVASAREATRSNDTHYRYRQDSDFFYLTGFDEPEAIAVIAPSKEQKYTLFVRPRDPEREI